MKTYTGETFFFPHSGKKGVILLHAYTGNSNDVRMLGRQLNWAGYTVCAPLFTGHGGDPREILKKGSPADWQDDTRMAIFRLRDTGVDQIAIFGLSLGGLLATWAVEEDPSLLGGGVFASPITTWGDSNVPQYFPTLAEKYYRRVHTEPELISERLAWLNERLPAQLNDIKKLARQLAVNLNRIHRPFFIAQGGKDEMIDPNSGAQLRDRLLAQGTPVDFHYYPDATHLLTVNSAHRQLFSDVENYLNNLFEVTNDNQQ
ncbi:alpha/beta hydrolase [Limosilactobacillus avium]|uniref:alpha/beta hydrolase n=1 Tax=Limosilactobacillus avium TaxID=2991831 RepID=UPI0024BB1677|nr:alpha/beta fold hydrolase [Limosilactobacillus avium]